MRRFLPLFVTGMWLLANPQSKCAASFLVALNLRQADFIFLPHSDGSVEVNSYFVFSPINVGPVDRLTVEIRFVGSRAYLHDNGPLNQGIEAITLSLLPFNPDLYFNTDVTVEILGAQGDLSSGNSFFTKSVPFSGGLSWQVATDLTGSEFSFTGARFDFNIKSGTGPFTFNTGLFGFYGGGVRFEPEPSPVPTPPTFVIMLTGIVAGMALKLLVRLVL